MSGRRIAFMLGQPTQFDAPFFRFAAADGRAHITVLYVNAQVVDRELVRAPDWGGDLMHGYQHKTLPADGWLSWLSAELRGGRYDWIVINGYTTLPYLAALALASRRGIRTALRIDSVMFNAGGRLRRARKRVVLRVLDRLFDRFLAVGTLTREYLAHFGIRDSKVGSFPYLVDVPRLRVGAADRGALRGRLGIPLQARVVLAVAKMNAREAPWDLVHALEGAWRDDVWLVMVGDGEELPAIREAVARIGVRRAVFAGYIPYADLPGYYAMSDVFVHAAADEPWGVSVQEAMAFGLPVVVSSRVGAGHDLVVAGGNGFVYPLGDAVALRECLLRALALDAAAVRLENERILAQWSYARAWNAMLEGFR